MDTETGTNSPALFVGDNLALDFINTKYGIDEGKRDCFVSDGSVLAWLTQAGVLVDRSSDASSKGLLEIAVELRKVARQLVEKRKADQWADPSLLNRVLALGSRHLEIQWEKGGQPTLTQKQSEEHVAAVLVPVAEALALLLAEADFEHVRKCGCEDCTLLFHDRTKSRRRRWCSMAACGNRMKVGAYRTRLKGGT
ncbi:CGNR zinc finger domain-containing protein [Undibacterium sp. Ji49W]|uniref:CGNR zinc finger domain-containing protein n=1 Tax=Undibacterium sp. Ji49W TaxID=3413040 RepID=UPI003BF3E7AA